MGELREPVLGRRDASPVPPEHVSSAVQASAARLRLRSAGYSGGERSRPSPTVAASPEELQALGCTWGRPGEPEKRKRAREEIRERRHKKPSLE